MNLPQTRDLPDRPTTSAEDAEILSEIVRGELRLFDILVNRYKMRLTSYIGQRVKDRHHAEVVVRSGLRCLRCATTAEENSVR